MGFFDPCAVKAFQRLHAIGGVILHPLEYDQPIAWRLDYFAEYLESLGFAKIVCLDCILDQLFGRLFERLLHFADADAAMALEAQMFFNHQASKESGFARSPATPRAFVSGWIEQRHERCCCWDLQAVFRHLLL